MAEYELWGSHVKGICNTLITASWALMLYLRTLLLAASTFLQDEVGYKYAK